MGRKPRPNEAHPTLGRRKAGRRSLTSCSLRCVAFWARLALAPLASARVRIDAQVSSVRRQGGVPSGCYLRFFFPEEESSKAAGSKSCLGDATPTSLMFSRNFLRSLFCAAAV